MYAAFDIYKAINTAGITANNHTDTLLTTIMYRVSPPAVSMPEDVQKNASKLINRNVPNRESFIDSKTLSEKLVECSTACIVALLKRTKSMKRIKDNTNITLSVDFFSCGNKCNWFDPIRFAVIAVTALFRPSVINVKDINAVEVNVLINMCSIPSVDRKLDTKAHAPTSSV